MSKAATDELRKLVEQHPDHARGLADRADDPIRSRLLELLDESEGGRPR